MVQQKPPLQFLIKPQTKYELSAGKYLSWNLQNISCIRSKSAYKLSTRIFRGKMSSLVVQASAASLPPLPENRTVLCEGNCVPNPDDKIRSTSLKEPKELAGVQVWEVGTQHCARNQRMLLLLFYFC